MSRFPLLRFRLPENLKDTRHLREGERYDLLSSAIPEFILSDNNPLIWQNELRHPYFKKRMGGGPGKRVLDLGCGWGFLARKFAADGARVVGLDLSAVTLKLALEGSDQARAGIGFVKGAGENLPFAEAFDVVTATDVLEHVEDLEATIAEVARVLKPGGLFGFVTVNKTRLARFIYITMGETFMGLLPRGTHRYSKFIEPIVLETTLRKCGMELEDMRGILVNPVLRKYHFWPSLAIEYIGVGRKRSLL